MDIHWSFWFIIGATVAITSFIVGEKLIIFLYIGLLFIMIGIGKLVYNYVTAKDIKETKPIARDIYYRPEKTEQYKHPTISGIIFCRNCGTKIRSTDNFCYKCGVRAK